MFLNQVLALCIVVVTSQYILRTSDTVQPSNYSTFSNSDTSSGDDSFYLPSSSHPTKTETDQNPDAVLNQVILNLGGEIGIMSLENDNGYPTDPKPINDKTSASFYTTAVDYNDQTLKAASKFSEDLNISSESDELCVTALDSTVKADVSASTTENKIQTNSVEDCLAAFDSLAISSKQPSVSPMLSTASERDNVRRLSDASAFCVIDFNAEGQPVEHTLRYLPKASNTNESSAKSLETALNVGATLSQKDLNSTETFVDQNIEVQTPSLPSSETNNISQSCNTDHQTTGDVDSYAANSSESFKDTLPYLVLPNAQSNTTSLDSTPFLTPEADITVSEFDPFSSKLTTAEDNGFSAPLAEVDTDGDTTTSSDTLTSRTALEENLDPAADLDPTPAIPELHPAIPEEGCDHPSETDRLPVVDQTSATTNAVSLDLEDELLSMFSGMKLENKVASPVQHKQVKEPRSFDSKTDSVLSNTSNLAVSTDNLKQTLNVNDTSMASMPDVPSMCAADIHGKSLLENEPALPKQTEVKTKPHLSVLQEKQNLHEEKELSKPASKKISKKDQNLLDNINDFMSVVKDQHNPVELSQFNNPPFNTLPSEHTEEIISSHDDGGKDNFCKGDGNFQSTLSPSPKAAGVARGDGDSIETVRKSGELIHETNENSKSENVAILPAKGAYSIDFDKFDDPNFDPFQTKPGKVGTLEVEEQFAEINIKHTDDTGAVEATESRKSDVSKLDSGENILENTNAEISGLQELQGVAFDQNRSSESPTISNSPASFEVNKRVAVEEDGGNCETEQDKTASTLVDYNQQKEENDKYDDVPLAKGAYSINFDDPNFDPFKTKTAISNEEGLSVNSDAKANISESTLPKYFEEKQTVKELNETKQINIKEEKLSTNVAVTEETLNNDVHTVMSSVEESAPISHKPANVTTPDDEKTHPSQEFNEEVPLPAQGAYSVDFSKFDDPNYDPFKTTKALINDADDSSVVSKDVTESEPVIETISSEETLNKPKEQPSEKNALETLSASEELRKQGPVDTPSGGGDISALLGAYSFDSNKFDDPNYDPFKTTKGLENDCQTQIAEVQPTNTISTVNVLSPVTETFGETVTTHITKDKEISEQPKVISHDNHLNTEVSDTQEHVVLSNKEVFQSTDFSVLDEFDPMHVEPDVSAHLPPIRKGAGELSYEPGYISGITDKTQLSTNIEENNELSTKIQNHETTEVPVSKGAYAIDYSQFDDPNFDPFKTNKRLALVESVGPKSAEQEPSVKSAEVSNIEKQSTAANSELGELVESKSAEPETSVKNAEVGNIEEQSITASSDEKPCIPRITGTNVEQSTKEVENLNEENQSIKTEEALPPKGSYSIDFDKLDDPNFNPFQTKAGMGNDSAMQVSNKESTKNNDAEIEKKVTVKKAASKRNIKSKTRKQKLKPVSPPVEKCDETDEIPVSKGAYSIDFSKFDDPNYDPFKTTKGLTNDETLQANDEQQVKTTVSEEIQNLSLANNDFVSQKTEKISETKDSSELESPKQPRRPKTKQIKSCVKQKRLKSPKPQSPDADEKVEGDEIPVSKGAYSIDFSKFDDPNYDPFKTTKGLTNDETLQDGNQNKVKSTVSEEKQNLSLANDDSVSPKIEEKSETKDTKGLEVPRRPKTKQNKSSVKQKRFKSPKPQSPDADEKVEGDEIPVSKGAYSIDFSKFDDPNYDPFKTTKGLSNDETLQANDEQQVKSTVSEEIQNLSLANDDFVSQKTAKISETKDSSELESPKQPRRPKTKQIKSAVKQKRLKSPKPKSPDADEKVEGDEIPVSKGAYSIDFSKFDDPNYDPFKTTKGLTNDETLQDDNQNQVKSTVSEEKQNLSLANDDSVSPKIEEKSETKDAKGLEVPRRPKTKQNKSSVKQKRLKSPKPKSPDADEKVEGDEIPVSKGAYSIDFSKFDDPNYDPFKTTKGLTNDETLQDDNQNQVKSTVSEEKQNLSLANDDSVSPKIEEKSETKDAKGLEAPRRPKTKQNKSSVKQKRLKSPKPQSPDADEKVEGDEIPAKGAYSIDFSEFDDPNYDPFKTSGGLSNDDKTVIENKPEFSDVTETTGGENQVEKSPAKTNVAKTKLKKKKQTLPTKKKFAPPEEQNKPAEEQNEEIPAKGAYSIDFNQLEDPNFDPFKTSKSLTNDNVTLKTTPSPRTSEVAVNKAETDPVTRDSQAQQMQVGEEMDGFQPAEQIFGSEENLTGWKELWKKQDNAPEESALRKQSLYVQFDPLMQKRAVMDNKSAMIEETDENVSCSGSDAIIKTNADRFTNIIDQDLDNMTTFEPIHQHPAASQLARNLLNEDGKWNSIETPTAKLLDLSLSPRPEVDSRTTLHTHRGEDTTENDAFVKESYQKLEDENQRLKEVEADLLRQIEEEKRFIEVTDRDLLTQKKSLEADLARVDEQHERVAKELTSSVNVFEDYYKRTKELIQTVFTLKKADEELKQRFHQKAALLKDAMSKYSTLKKEADSTIKRLEAEVGSASNDAIRRINAMKAQIKKEQMTVSSLEKQLENASKENAELVKICEEFFTQADKK